MATASGRPLQMHMQIRPAHAGDAPTLAVLCVEHAEYERLASRADAGLSERLAHALEAGRVHAWLLLVAEQVQGYASVTIDFSTMAAQPFLHMDCLYLRQGARGRGMGLALMQTLAAFGHLKGCCDMQWQTPAWNRRATRFYLRAGATALDKTRFTLPLGALVPPSDRLADLGQAGALPGAVGENLSGLTLARC
ncbi:GNAT family N-acetyltransferase [Paucibacter sp. AS339]|uniref:GNAT family N-acetyltransferase n=1 Tax=Paucibacter hankyongi TaxID=3133434 RepID=UPI0030A38F75